MKITPNQAPHPIRHQHPPSGIPNYAVRHAIIVIKYGAARFGLFLALTILIQLVSALVVEPLPIYIAALLALIVAFPLSVFVF